MDLKQIFAKNVRKRRAALGLSQDELGARADLARNYIGMIERCETSPTLDSVEAISAALEIDPDTLLRKTRAKQS